MGGGQTGGRQTGVLTAGATVLLPVGPWTLRVPGPYDLLVVVLGDDDRVAGDGDLVFFNQPAAPGVRLGRGEVRVDPAALRPGAVRLVLLAGPEDGRTPLGRLPAPELSVRARDGATLARFTAGGLSSETVVQVAEVYRRAGGWKVRALGAGYDDGLAGLVRDFGVHVDDDGDSAPPRAAGQGRAGSEPGRPAGDPVLAEVVTLTNAERTARGLVALRAEPRLAAAAAAHNADMGRRGFFAHDSPDGGSVADRVRAQGYVYRLVAENLASGQRTAAEVVDGWMHSPGHRANLLHPDVREIGVAFAHAGPHGTLWTQVFGTPL